MAEHKGKTYTAAYWRMCIGAMLFFLSFNMVLPEMPSHLRRLGGEKHLGWIISLFALFAMMARPVSGWVTDHLGRRWAILGGAGISVLAVALYPFSQTVALLFFARAMHGFCSGFAPTGFTAYTTDIVPAHKRGEALGWQGMFGNIGASVGFALGSAIVLLIGQNGLYWAAMGVAVAAFFVFNTLPETHHHKEPRRKPSLQNIFYWPVWQSALLMLLICLPMGGLLIVMPDYTEYLGFKNKGIYMAVYITFSLCVRIFSGRLSDRLGRPFSTAIGSFSQIFAMLLLAYSHTHLSFFISAGLYGIGQGFNAPGLFAWAGDESTVHTRGRALGTLFIALELGVFIGGIVLGQMYNDNIANLPAYFVFCAVVSLITFVLSLIFIRQHRNKKNAVPVVVEGI